MKFLATALAVIGGLFIAYIGVSYLVDAQGAASGFGVLHVPAGDAGGYFAVKGVRDIGQALVILVLLLTGQHRTLGWVMLAMSFVPFGDMTIVLAQGGKVASALGIHGATALVVVLTGALLLRANPRVRSLPEVV
ncbi:hypothetical protein FHR32_005540 [Streptosporangium album]|uniref:Small membrane hydrophobic protein n=1 Tax=Streptosporangium album TaxID=47479 RepID=A0A7W7RZM7_9ACTN|nr:DUF4267 domain-containing protein [Streptosporangium album]MBB4941163.1 hypothetical protein [Streptosporangium album]